MITGRAWAFGDRVSIEYISPLRYMFQTEGRGAACLAFLDRTFAAAEKDGDLIVAGSHFGQGPGHDHAVLAILESGVAGVIARSFAPQFFRHAIAHGLPVATHDDILELVRPGDRVAFDFARGAGRNLTTGTTLTAEVPRSTAAAIVERGGLVPFLGETLRSGPETDGNGARAAAPR